MEIPLCEVERQVSGLSTHHVLDESITISRQQGSRGCACLSPAQGRAVIHPFLIKSAAEVTASAFEITAEFHSVAPALPVVTLPVGLQPQQSSLLSPSRLLDCNPLAPYLAKPSPLKAPCPRHPPAPMLGMNYGCRFSAGLGSWCWYPSGAASLAQPPQCWLGHPPARALAAPMPRAGGIDIPTGFAQCKSKLNDVIH